MAEITSAKAMARTVRFHLVNLVLFLTTSVVKRSRCNRNLEIHPKQSCWYYRKVLNSAIANAENNFGLEKANLVVSEAFANEGPTMKRFRPRAKGSASPINKRTSHITVAVAEK